MGKFQDLNVWARAKNLAVFVYKLTQTGKFSKDYDFRDQIQAVRYIGRYGLKSFALIGFRDDVFAKFGGAFDNCSQRFDFGR